MTRNKKPQSVHNVAKRLEARALIESTSEYSPNEIDDVMDVYNDVIKHIGFEDKRSDKRFIVKFHNVYYYMPDEYRNKRSDEWEILFNAFCEMQHANILEEVKLLGVDIDDMLTRHSVGHYRAFRVDIPRITEDNAAQVAIEVYEKHYPDDYMASHYVSNYVHIVGLLQDLEDNYMDYWIEFLREEAEAGVFSATVLEQIKTKYNNDKIKERRIAWMN